MPEENRIRVLSVDDHPLMRDGIAASINAQADMVMVAEAASGSKTPKEAAERAQKRAERYYKL